MHTTLMSNDLFLLFAYNRKPFIFGTKGCARTLNKHLNTSMRALFGLLLYIFVFTISNDPCIAIQSKQNRTIFTKMDPAPNIVPRKRLGLQQICRMNQTTKDVHGSHVG